jgi:ABC-type multidrug transport system fused ATPase/permease subunit
MIVLSVLLLAGIAAQLAGPQIMRVFIDATQHKGASNTTLLAALSFILFSVIQRATAIGTVYVGEDLGWRTTNRLRRDLTNHVLRLDLGFHKLHTPGELMERIDGDCDKLRNFFSQFGIRVLSNIVLVFGILALVWYEDWRVGLGISCYAIAVFATLFALQRLAVGHWAAYSAANAATSSFLEERMAAAEDIRSSAAEAYTLGQLDHLTNQQLQRRRLAEMIANVTFASTNFLFLIGYAVGLGVGAALYTSGQASIGTAFLIVLYIGMLSEPLETIRGEAQDLQMAAASIGRIAELFGEQPRVREQIRAALPKGALAVAFDGVTFAYNDQQASNEQPSDQALPAEPVLHNIAFRLEAGQILGLLGRTGSGKSTLARLAARLYDPDTGSVRLGGIDVRDVAFSDLRTRIGVVTQDVQIFQATIRENLTLFRSDIPDTALEAALAELGLLEWVQGLPDGLNTQLGPSGLGLSAGESQLLAFARMFLKDPGLVIMDEASSRLDPATERLLEQAVTRLLAGRSAIIIAHRLSTIQRADTILILEQGSVAELGSRNTLVSDPHSRFASLLRVGMQEVLV